MASRNRPRGGPPREDPVDAHEETNMWNQIVADLKKLSAIQLRARDVSKLIVDMETDMKVKSEDCKSTSLLYE